MKIVVTSEMYDENGKPTWRRLVGTYGTFLEAYGAVFSKLSGMVDGFCNETAKGNFDFSITPIYTLGSDSGYGADLKKDGKVVASAFILYLNDNEDWTEGVDAE